jgi:ferrochelatase
VEEVTHRYSLIGRSPLTDITLTQARLLSDELGLRTYVGMRNWKPFISEAIAQMTADGIQHAVVICLAPQNSRTSVGLYRSALTRNRQLPFDFIFVESWHDHPLLVRAFAEKLQSGWKKACAEFGGRLPIIFTAHSVPERTITEGDPYEAQAKETASLVAQAASLSSDDWSFAFQSQGMSGGKWLGPTVEDTMTQLKSQGYGGIFIQPIGFLCDHVEILYDIDIGFKRFADQLGIGLWRAESLNDSRLLASALADITRSRLAAKVA